MTARPSLRNLVYRTGEGLKPPVCEPNTSLQHRLENRLRRFELGQARGALLDIGYGAQIYRELIPFDVSYCGIDIIEAKEEFGYQIPDTHYCIGDEWRLGECSFALALCTEGLEEHIQNRASFLERTFRHLKPGGQLVMTVPFAARWHFIPYDYCRFTRSSLNMLLPGAVASFANLTMHSNWGDECLGYTVTARRPP